MGKISTKIIALLGVLVFVICFGLGVVSYKTSYKSLIGVLEETIPKVAQEAAITIEDGIDNHLNKLEIIASLEYMEVLNEEDPDTATIQSIISNEVKRSGHREMILVNKDGRALYHDGRVADMSSNPFFIKALAGNKVISEPMKDRISDDVIMYYAVPIVLKGEVIGVLMAVRDGLELSEFAGRIKFGKTGEAFIINSRGKTIAHANKDLMREIVETHVMDSISSATFEVITSATGEAPETISSATTESTDGSSGADGTDAAESQNSKKELGFEGFSDIQYRMMEGQIGFGEYQYKGVDKVVGFAPIERYMWSIAVSYDRAEALSGLSELRQSFLMISLVFLLTGLIVAYFIGTSISRPISSLAQLCTIISNGDFSKMEEKYIKRRDEIGDLARGFNNINVNVSKIIKNVVSETGSVSSSIDNINDNMAGLTDDIDNMSNIINKLSSKMDETSAMAQEMHAVSSEIESAIDVIVEKSYSGARFADEVSRRAKDLESSAIESQKKAQDIQLNVAAKLKDAIEKSKAVEKIKILSDVILDISSKTNLLALNAAIEASHAGKYGSGFAIVAGEIREMADNIKNTINEIQRVTKQVIDSVEELSSSSQLVLEFLEDRVVKDYNILVDTGKQYNEDAQLITDMVNDLNATTEQLYASIHNMVKAINDVAIAAEKGALETSDLANEATVVVRRTKEVLEKTKDVQESTNKLSDLVSIFEYRD